MRTKACPTCGKEIEYRSKMCWDCFQAAKARTYCIDCGRQIKKGQDRCWQCHTKQIAVPERTCIDCGSILPRYGNGERCKACQIKSMTENAKQWFCVDCGTPVNRRVKRCGDCAHKYRVGKPSYPRTEAWKENIRKKMTGRSIEWRTGKPHKPETRRKMREFWDEEKRQAASKRWKGEGNPAYTNGEHLRQWPREFDGRLRLQIRKRDGYVCQECHNRLSPRSRMVHVHHIDYDKNNNNPINLITLCWACHAKTNFNRAQWQAHFESLQVQRARNGFLPESNHPEDNTNPAP